MTSTFDWFLAQLKPNAHKIAKRNLERQGFNVFLPEAEETRRRSGRFITEVKPVFPGYVFVGFDALQGGWRAVNSTLGVTRIVSFGREPAPVPAGLISALKRRFDEAGAPKETDEFQPGQEVKIAIGPFADFVAQVETIEPDRRVWVLLDFMGRKTRTAVPRADLRRA